MKGIAHFFTGIALSTFLPVVVSGAARGGVLPVLGGVAGILPDTLDFKFIRFLEKHDVAIDPGLSPTAGLVAKQISDCMQQAYRTGRRRTAMLHTVRLDVDSWRRYAVRIELPRGEVVVQIGPVVSTAQVPVPGSELPGESRARVLSNVPMAGRKAVEIVVDAFSGPTIAFVPQGDALDVRFLDWHRRWTHSLTFAVVLGLVVGGIMALAQAACAAGVSALPLTGGIVAALGVVGHIFGDQLGATGSNLLYPLTKRRTRGFGWIQSGDAVPNMLSVWVSAATILLNLDRFSATPVINPLQYVLLVIVAPMLILGASYGWRRGRRARDAHSQSSPEAVSELAEADVG